ncbi:hypothetical protein DDZ13_04485 [Coraliomargarita sinensis]|uniref:Sialate O-acetylesterase domain-containing protein n=1 Tax=Coraliomargarita sinensis TaxID=2174842 RepID=A0A317ZHN4_9BACT|nr:sialate O-acetylesterase [Coraliomargarita sinensis]PXA05224.1 hypothetical protein DDZ13_04485 [Coraliomargarita sinensis]
MKRIPVKLVLLAALFLAASIAQAKPLKVYILCGQSNMEGHAQTKTFPAIAKDPETKYLYDKIVDAEGKPRVFDGIWIEYAYGNFHGDPVGKRSGKLTAGYGSQHHVGTGKIGPELTFGITMQEHHNEPILLIKAAWGGKSLMVDFRPPSAGELEDHKHKDKAGRYYNLLIEHVREVLAKTSGDYELAGFVWFQGFNDMVGPYPKNETSGGKDFSEYSRLLSCFIRDVRKDLGAPELPFVVGVLGVGGKDAGDNALAFREGMAAPAMTDEFKGNVVNVFSEKYWPEEIDAVQEKVQTVKRTFSKQWKEVKQLEGEARKEAQNKLKEEERAAIDAALTEDELFTLDVGTSNRGFHYHGSAKFFAQLGEAFAKSLISIGR